MKTSFAAVAAVIAMFAGAAHAATISVSPTTQNQSPGSLVQVDLNIAGVNVGTTLALGAWDVNVSVDPSILTFSSATFGTNLDVSGLGDIQSVSPVSSGTTELYEISFDSTEDLTNLQAQNFTLATLYFDAVGSGTSPINIGINDLSDADGGGITADVVPGSATVSAVPLPSSVWLLGCGIPLLIAMTRRSRHQAVRPILNW